MARNSANMIIRDAVETALSELLDIQKAAFMRYTDWFLPDQIPPSNETLDEVRRDFQNKHILVMDIKPFKELDCEPDNEITHSISSGADDD